MSAPPTPVNAPRVLTPPAVGRIMVVMSTIALVLVSRGVKGPWAGKRNSYLVYQSHYARCAR